MEIDFIDLEQRLQSSMPSILEKSDSSHQITSSITSEVTNWFSEKGFIFQKEMPIWGVNYSRVVRFQGGKKQGAARTIGRLDVVAQKGSCVVAIEIDRIHNQRSIDKLMKADSKGFQTVWIRWSGEIGDVPGEIFLIDLT